ncbi:STAS domain-containing protein [Filobacillus milosensis]|uniref:STAS domain-containing protein n=1 Tax=Filobacillus milosensis TaxID=94137 RepID=A0A4Y8IH00_9BACI|nr:STAS domain-containing protein [Filobacillus milosensis]TFB14591.1 STAS domain-containing protein [Filobacillus milosensis]
MSENTLTVKQEIELMGKKLEEKKYDIATLLAADPESIDDEQAQEIRAQLAGFFADACLFGVEGQIEKMSEWGMNTGKFAIERGTELNTTLERVSNLRLIIWGEVEKIAKENDFSIESIFELIRRLDPVLDEGIYSFTTAFIENYKTKIQESHDNFLVLSAPVVPLMQGSAVLPVVGNVDTERAEILLDTALKEANNQDLNNLFIDLSGVPVIDTMVASHIYNIVESMELVGTHAILVGIRPEVAQTMVNLGLHFKNIETHSTLNQALVKHKVFE